MFLRKITKLESNFSKLRLPVLFFAFFVTGPVNYSYSHAGDDYDTEVGNSESAAKKSQTTNFFANNEGSQNFFSNRNFSSNTIFNSAAEPSLITNSVIQVPPVPARAVEESHAVEPVQAQVPSTEETEVVQENPNIDESLLAKNSNLDPNLKDVMEHSRKIREAIFGEEAAKKLPSGIREKLQSKFPNADSQETRF